MAPSPVGTTERGAPPSIVPTGLSIKRQSVSSLPSNKLLGYCRCVPPGRAAQSRQRLELFPNSPTENGRATCYGTNVSVPIGLAQKRRNNAARSSLAIQPELTSPLSKSPAERPRRR